MKRFSFLSKAISAFVAASLLFAFSVNASASEAEDSANELSLLTAKYGAEYLKNSDRASELYSNLQHSFNENLCPTAEDYPDYYGGSYINGDGNLVVYITEDYAKQRAHTTEKLVLSLAGASEESIVFQPAEYSFKHLTQIMDKLNTFKQSDTSSAVKDNFNVYMILDKENKIEVQLDVFDEAHIDAFKAEVSDDDSIYFVQKYDDIELSSADAVTEIKPGNEIHNNSKNVHLSVGYRVQISSTRQGFLTSAHGVRSGDEVGFGTGNIPMGYGYAEQLSGSVDATFCIVDSSDYEASNILAHGGGELSTTIESPAAEAVVNMQGAKTNAAVNGKVVSTNASTTITVDDKTITLTNVTSTDYVSDSGDSGGIVYTYRSSTGIRNTVGLHESHSSTHSFYIKAALANSALGVSRY